MSLSNKAGEPRRLRPEFVERIWGSTVLEPWFPNPQNKIGEVWFQEPDSTILVKFLFTTGNLSVQVHPSDALARECGHVRGKTEMWHILRAEPSAKIALGFMTPPTEEQVRRAAADGSIMEMLRWIPVSAGDSWFIPAGAVHAIGAGITLCEVQQNSDVTYRLFDYGRGRNLHVEESLRALDLSFEPSRISPETKTLVDCSLFQVNRIDISGDTESVAAELTIPLEGTGHLNGLPFRQGQVWNTAESKALRLTGKARLLTVTTRI